MLVLSTMSEDHFLGVLLALADYSEYLHRKSHLKTKYAHFLSSQSSTYVLVRFKHKTHLVGFKKLIVTFLAPNPLLPVSNLHVFNMV